jgi:RNA polymerase sigma-70 factor, ECF subfamily
MIAERHAADPGLLALDAAWRTCEARVGRFLAQVVESRSDAEDLLQETWAAAFRDRRRLVAHPAPEAWLMAIARNRALAHLRRARRGRAAWQRLRGGDVVDEGDRDAVVDTRRLLARLPADDRVLLVLRFVHGYTAEELAAIYSITAEAARKRISRARARLLREHAKEAGR